MDHAHPPAEPRAGRSLLAVGGPAAAAAIIISIVGLTTGDFGRLAEPVISAGLVVAAAAFFVALRFTDVMERAALKAQASRLAALSDEAGEILKAAPISQVGRNDRPAA